MPRNEQTIKVDTIFAEAARCLKGGQLPSHDVFTVSEILGAALSLDKEYVIEQIFEKNR